MNYATSRQAARRSSNERKMPVRITPASASVTTATNSVGMSKTLLDVKSGAAPVPYIAVEPPAPGAAK